MKRLDSTSNESVFLDKRESPAGRCKDDVPISASKRFLIFFHNKVDAFTNCFLALSVTILVFT